MTKSTDKLICLRIMFIFEKFISCNGLKYRKIRSKSRGNNPLKLFKVCTGSLWCIFKSSAVTYNIGIMPGGTYEMTQFRIVCHGTDEDMRPKMHSFIPSKIVSSNMPSSPFFMIRDVKLNYFSTPSLVLVS